MKGKTQPKNHFNQERIIELIKENCQIKDITRNNVSKYYAKVLYI